MLILDYKLRVNQAQSRALDEAIRTVQFIRNKCLRKWMDGRGVGDNDLQVYCAQLAKAYPFAARLNSQARQTSADRAWLAIARFYKHCRDKKPGKKGYPRFQHDNRSVEYKQTGWRLEADGQHLTFTDGMGIGTVRLIGANPRRKQARPIATFPVGQIKRVRLVKRADGYYVQFAVKVERKTQHAPTGREVGIDVGLKTYYTASDGQTVENPRLFRKAEKQLKRLHRRLSRKKKGGKNRHKARKQLAKAYLKGQRQRKDFAAKAASALVSSSDLIAYEDLHSWPGVAGRLPCERRAKPYRWASGNGQQHCCERFGTVHLYARVRQGTAQAGWMNEESPGFNRESVNAAEFPRKKSASDAPVMGAYQAQCAWTSIF